MINRSKRNLLSCGLAASVLMTGQAMAQTGATAGTGNLLDNYVLFGINAKNDKLVTYRFADTKFQAIDTVHFSDGTTLSGIEASAHVPGHLNLFAFWTDPADQETKLVYINSETAEAEVMGQSIGPGAVTGATIAWKDSDGELDEGGDNISGMIGINPNNYSTNEFKLMCADGTVITRDDLHSNTPVDGSGEHFNGDAYYIKVHPKGPGSQNDLKVEGSMYSVTNGNAYVISGGTVTCRVFNDNVNGAGKAMGQWWLEISDSHTSVIHEAGGDFGYNGLFALQTIESTEEDDVEFDVINDEVVPKEDFAVKVTVLGAAITAGGAYDVPVTTMVKIGDDESETFGPMDNAVSGNINDDNNPRKHVFPSIYPAGTPISVAGQSWIKKFSWVAGNSANHWNSYITVTSTSHADNLIVLRHGDPVPKLDPFLDQDAILDFIIDYVDQDTDTIVLDENQAIFFYELGTTNLASDSADFQDLVVLVTLAKDPTDLENEDDDDDANAGAASRLVKVNTSTGGFEQIMTLDRIYDALAAADNGMFYATHQGHLYKLNPFDQAETHVGAMPASSVMGLEFAGATLGGFTVLKDQVIPLDPATGDAIGAAIDTLASHLHTIIFMDISDLPASFASFD